MPADQENIDSKTTTDHKLGWTLTAQTIAISNNGNEDHKSTSRISISSIMPP